MDFFKNSKPTVDAKDYIPSVKDIKENKKLVSSIFHETSDFKTRELLFVKQKAMILYLESMIDVEKIQKEVITPLTCPEKKETLSNILTSLDMKSTNNIKDAEKGLRPGDSGACQRKSGTRKP